MNISKLIKSFIDLVKWIILNVCYFFISMFVTDSIKTYQNKKVFIYTL